MSEDKNSTIKDKKDGSGMKRLAKDTAIYGLSSILGRFLNYLLVPFYTYILPSSSGGYGIVTNLYSYTALLLVILTYGMETTFLRYANKEGEDAARVYTTTLISVGTTSLLFVILVWLNLHSIANSIGGVYIEHPEYIGMMFTCVAIDAFQAIPFVYLRYKKRPIKFAALKLLFIFMSIVLNVLYLYILPHLYVSHPDLVGHIYNPSLDIAYIFRINLFCTGVITFFFYKELIGFKYVFDKPLMKRMLVYTWPLLILGIAGILNQTLSNILYPKLVPGKEGQIQLGMFGAASKIAMIMAMITQAFRYAYEPFVFGNSRNKDSGETYAKAMKYFIIFTLLAFLLVMGYMGLLRYIIGRGYWPGLKVVPIVMAAEIMMGIYFNLSFWYKLINKTIWGAYFSGIGCLVLVLINVIFVPRYGFIACAWAGFGAYGTCMVLSYLVGQKKYPINYHVADIMKYIMLAFVLYMIMYFSGQYVPTIVSLLINTLLIIVFMTYLVKKDFPLSSLPMIGKHFRKN
jgi:O-antigen/teichoic acid export membrane protein